jgi:hypothetical protein
MAKRVTLESLAKTVEQLSEMVTVLAQTQAIAAAQAAKQEQAEPSVTIPAVSKSAVGYTPPRIVAKPMNGKLKEVAAGPNAGPKMFNRAARAELWAYDEYNQGSIIGTGTDISKLIQDARRFVTETNVDNALTLDQKGDQWEAYFPEICKNGVPDPDAIYAGDKQNGMPFYYSRAADGSWKKEVLPRNAEVRFYLGEINRGRVKDEWYLSDFKGNEIGDLKSSLLERKTVLFIKILG